MNLFTNLLELWHHWTTEFPPTRGVISLLSPMPSLSDQVESLVNLAVRNAADRIGQGEEGGNNLGPQIAAWVFPAKPPQNWCGAFAGYCYQAAATSLAMPMPFKRSLGAKALGRNMAAVGRRFTDPEQARPGDLMIFDRGPAGSWMGHVGIVEDRHKTAIATIEGNAGPQVMRRVRSVRQDRFAFFASLRKTP